MPELTFEESEILSFFLSCASQWERTTAGMAGMVRTALPADRVAAKARQLGVEIDEWFAEKLEICAQVVIEYDADCLRRALSESDSGGR